MPAQRRSPAAASPSPFEFSFEASSPAETVVYVVEDESAVLTTLCKYLEKAGYIVGAYEHSSPALEAVRDRPPNILIVDEFLPGASGMDLATASLEIDPDIGIVMISGKGSETLARDALRLGALDYLIKPFEMNTLGRTVQRASQRVAERKYSRQASAWLREELQRKSDEVARVTIGALSALVNALEARWPHFEGHSRRVATMAGLVAKNLGLSEKEAADVRAGALLHDIGMIAVPDRIVLKSSVLSEEEYAEMKLHCQRGADIVAPVGALDAPARFIVEHHERLDGSGYPLGLEGGAISLGGQVVGIAETWAGIVEDRPYRTGQSIRNAREVISRTGGVAFSEEVVSAVLRIPGGHLPT